MVGGEGEGGGGGREWVMVVESTDFYECAWRVECNNIKYNGIYYFI